MTKRDVRLDSLRGLFLVLMTIDHIGGKITNLTYQPLGFVSAAAYLVLHTFFSWQFLHDTWQGLQFWKVSIEIAVEGFEANLG